MRERLNAHLWRCDRCGDEHTVTDGRSPDGWSAIRHLNEAEQPDDLCAACTNIVRSVLRTDATTPDVGHALDDLTTRHLAALDLLSQWREALADLDAGLAAKHRSIQSMRLERCINELAAAIDTTTIGAGDE